MKSEARNLNFETIPNDQNPKLNVLFHFNSLKSLFVCHSRAGGNPEGSQRCWIPAFAGMTNPLGTTLVDFFKKIN
jgi:hypothetical protein